MCVGLGGLHKRRLKNAALPSHHAFSSFCLHSALFVCTALIINVFKSVYNYTLPTLYLHSVYTLSALYLHSVYTLSVLSA